MPRAIFATGDQYIDGVLELRGAADSRGLLVQATDLTNNPLFVFGRIVNGPLGPKMRLVSSDDVLAEKSVWEIERTGTMATIRDVGSYGSYVEGFQEGYVEPDYRINGFSPGTEGIQLEFRDVTAASAVKTDVALRRTGAQILQVVGINGGAMTDEDRAGHLYIEGGQLGFLDVDGSADVGLTRDSAGVLRVTDAGAGTGTITGLASNFDSSTYSPTLTASSGNESVLVVSPTINQSGTASYRALEVAITHTSTGSGTDYPILVTIGGNNVLRLNTSGGLQLADSVGFGAWGQLTAGLIRLNNGGSGNAGGQWVPGSSLQLNLDTHLTFSGNSQSGVGVDVGLIRSSAGILRLSDGSTGVGDLIVTNLWFNSATGARFRSDDSNNIYASSGTGTNQHARLHGEALLLHIDGSGNTAGAFIPGGALGLSSGTHLTWSNSSAYNVGTDTGLNRDSAGVVKVTDGSTGLGSLWTENIDIDGDQRTLGAIWPVSDVLISPQTGTTMSVRGSTVTNTGTPSHPTLANTNRLAAMRRTQFASAAGAGSSAGTRGPATLTWRGDAAGLGGFRFMCRFGSATTLAQQRSFVGLSATTGALANANPSSFLNLIGVGYDSAQTTLRIIHNDGSGTATTVDLGANFPVGGSNVYDVFLSADANGSNVTYRVVNLGTSNEANGTISTDLPSAATFLTFQVWVNNGTTASAAQISMNRIYLATPGG